jgi:hypothetical protein
MLKRLVIYFLLICTISANFSMLFIYAGFEVNKGYIASTLCENRNKPWLHCNGRCYLMKKIKQAEDKEKSEERQSNKSLFQEAIVENAISFNFQPPLIAVLNTCYPQPELPQYSTTIFQPPKAA